VKSIVTLVALDKRLCDILSLWKKLRDMGL